MSTLSAEQYNAMVRKSNDSKYKNKRATRIIDGKEVKFHSEMEARRSDDLERMKHGGLVENIQRQRRYPLIVEGDQITTYVADFVYYDREKERIVVEDVKGAITDTYRIKKKLMKAVHKIDIVEVKA